MVSPRLLRSLKREFRESLMAKLGVAIVLLLLVVAAFAPVFTPYNPTNQNLSNARQPPIGFSSAVTEEVPLQENGSVVIENGDIVTVNRTVYKNATWAHPLGTDSGGRDILSRVIYGARTSMSVGILGTLLAAVFGVAVGLHRAVGPRRAVGWDGPPAAVPGPSGSGIHTCQTRSPSPGDPSRPTAADRRIAEPRTCDRRSGP